MLNFRCAWQSLKVPKRNWKWLNFHRHASIWKWLTWQRKWLNFCYSWQSFLEVTRKGNGWISIDVQAFGSDWHDNKNVWIFAIHDRAFWKLYENGNGWISINVQAFGTLEVTDKTTKILNLLYTGILVETDMTLKIDWLYAIPELWEKIDLTPEKFKLRYTGILGGTDMTPKVYWLYAIPKIWVKLTRQQRDRKFIAIHDRTFFLLSVMHETGENWFV